MHEFLRILSNMNILMHYCLHCTLESFQHKCGYCGWLFSFTTNFLEHECFKNFVEDEDRINVDESYVVTICMFTAFLYFSRMFSCIIIIKNVFICLIIQDNTKTVEGPACTDTLDELLIGAVKARKGLYDYRIPANQRTNLRKNALWARVLEVSNTLGGTIYIFCEYICKNFIHCKSIMKIKF